jgi:2-methylcitrate dehydratase PrpD
MASLGFTGTDTILEGERGFGRAFAGKLDVAPLTDGLGEVVPVIVEYKPYSCARPIHNAIDCALELRPKLRGRLDAIETITVRRHPMWAHYHVIGRPRTYHEAQVSLPYSVAVALVDGMALPAQYTDSRVTGDAQLLDLADRVVVEPDESLARGVSCHMIVTMRSGEVLESVVDYPLGSIQNPMDDEALIRKNRELATPLIGADRFEQFVRMALDFEHQSALEALFDVIAVD